MSTKTPGVVSAIAIVGLGVGWLLNNIGIFPAVEWIWTIGLALTGALTIAFLGFDKATVVVGPFLIISSVFSIFRQTGALSIRYEIPILVIIFGLLLLIAVLSPLKNPEWLVGKDETRN